MAEILAVRDLLLSRNPFILGRYPERPAPAHVLNGFVVAALGGSKRGDSVRALLKGEEPLSADVPSITKAKWAKNSEALLAARADMDLVLNPDRRSWEDIGSLVPLDPRISASDGSDDKFGSYVWSLMRSSDATWANSLVEYFFVDEPAIEDPATVMARILADGAVLDCLAPGVMEARIPRKDASHGSTTEVPGGASGARGQDDVGGPQGSGDSAECVQADR